MEMTVQEQCFIVKLRARPHDTAGVLNRGYPYPFGVWEPNAGGMGQC